MACSQRADACEPFEDAQFGGGVMVHKSHIIRTSLCDAKIAH